MQAISAAALPAVLSLNNAHATETSRLTAQELGALVSQSFVALESGGGQEGFVIAFASEASYSGQNFLWFKARYERFVYIDRIVVAEAARGRGLARSFYQALFDRARAAELEFAACEINVDPPNPGSDAFHERMGFQEVGRAFLADRGKLVRYVLKSLNEAA